MGIRQGNIGMILPLLFISLFVASGILYMLIPLTLKILSLLGLYAWPVYENHTDERIGILPSGYLEKFPPLSFWTGAVICGTGLYLAITCAGPPLVKWNKIRAWEKTPCEIIVLNVETSKKLSPKGERLIDRGVRYDYEYQGRKFFGVGNLRVPESRANDFAISCYVNPKNPSESTLNRDVRSREFGVGGMGLLIIFLGMIILGIGSRRWAKNIAWDNPDLLKKERLLFWILLILSWSAFAAVFLLADACGREAEGQPFQPGTGILVFFSVIAGLFILRFIYHLYRESEILPKPPRRIIKDIKSALDKRSDVVHVPPQMESIQFMPAPIKTISPPAFLGLAILFTIVLTAFIANDIGILLSFTDMPPFRALRVYLFLPLVPLLVLLVVLMRIIKKYTRDTSDGGNNKGIANLIFFILFGGLIFTLFILGPVWMQREMRRDRSAVLSGSILSTERLGTKPETEPADYRIEYSFELKGKKYYGNDILRSVTPDQVPKEGPGDMTLKIRHSRMFPKLNRIDRAQQKMYFTVNGKPASPRNFILIPLCVVLLGMFLTVLFTYLEYKKAQESVL